MEASRSAGTTRSPVFTRCWRAPSEKAGPRGNLSRAEYIERLEKASIVNTLDNLMTFPRLRELIRRGTISAHGAYFGVATGQLSVLDRATGGFKPVAK